MQQRMLILNTSYLILHNETDGDDYVDDEFDNIYSVIDKLYHVYFQGAMWQKNRATIELDDLFRENTYLALINVDGY